MRAEVDVELKVADEVWIAAALLHREHRRQTDFSIEEIVHRVQEEKLSRPFRKSVYVHVVQHCVANRPPNSGRYRMLFETTPGRRRLFRTGDPYDRAREGAKIIPATDDIPAKYASLLDWYSEWSKDNIEDRIKNDPLLALRGSGSHIWADEDADTYIRRLREGWE
jgi:hypothetical protein